MLYLDEFDIVRAIAEKHNVEQSDVTLKIDGVTCSVTAIVNETSNNMFIDAHANSYTESNGNLIIETAEGVTFRIPKENISPEAMEMIEKEGRGVIVYLNQEGRGIGLMNKMKAYKLQEDGMDTVDANICLGHLADERDYGVGAQILRELGVHKMRLMTNNPVKRVGLEAYGLEITENVPIETTPNPYNERYLRTKKERMGHTLHFNNK